MYRLLRLLKISNPNLICKLTTFSEILEEKPKIIKLSYNLINEILGPIKGSDNTAVNYISPILIGKYLNRLKFSYQFKKSDLSWDVKIPYFRSEDINRPIDLIEEIGRLHGFNQFLTRLPKIQRIGLEDPSYKARKKLSSYFLNLCFN